MLALGCWPLLRTGRYWLTTRRLVWKPRLGELKQVWVEDIDADEIRGDKLKSKLVVRGDDRKVVVRYVSGMDRLWGGILLLANMDPDELVPSGKGVADVAWWRGGRSTGLRQQVGLLVLRPEYVAFLPTVGSKHLGVEFFKESVGKAVKESLGMDEEFPAEATLPFDVLVGLMSEQSPEKFDRFVENAVEQFDGLLWWRDDVEVFRESVPLIPSRAAVAFRSEGVKLAGLPARDQDDTIARLLDGWNDGAPVRTRYPLARVALVAAIVTGLAALVVYQGNALEEPIVEVGAVAPDRVMDPAAAPERAFVSVSGHVDPDRVMHLKAERKNGPAHVLVVLREAPQLILYLPDDHDLAQALKKRDAAKGRKAANAAEAELAQAWTVSGRLYAGGSDGRPNAKIPVTAVRDFVQKEAGAADVKSTRVLMVGLTPMDQIGPQRLTYAFACALGAFGVLLWCDALRALVPGRVR